MKKIEFGAVLNYLVIAVMVCMIAMTAAFIYESNRMKGKIVSRMARQTDFASTLLAQSALEAMKGGHGADSYGGLAAYASHVGADDVRILGRSAHPAFSGHAPAAGAPTKTAEQGSESREMENILKAMASGTGAWFLDEQYNSYTGYTPLKAEAACSACHKKEGEVLGVLKVRLLNESDSELLAHVHGLLFKLWIIISLPVIALIASGVVIRDKNRLYRRLRDINQNLTKTYNELNGTQYYIQMILDNSKVIIVTTDNNGCIVEFNKESERLLEYAKEEVAGKSALLLYEAQSAEVIGGKAGSPDGVPWDIRNREVKLRSKSGRIYDIALTLSTMVNDQGKIIGTVGIGKDISEQKMLQYKLLQSQKLAGIGTLASGIAHEINNPLAGILGMAEAMLEEDDMKLIKDYTRDIIQYTIHARDIVKELSAYSREAKGENETLSLDAVISNSLKMARHSAAFDGIDTVMDIEEHCMIKASPSELQQVFVNLMINAVHAMGEGGRMAVRCRREGVFIKASVTDSGHGISEADLSQIFDPFFTTKPAGTGTGLGLYVVYKIVTKYGGSIDVESATGVGTTFTLRFPAADRLT